MRELNDKVKIKIGKYKNTKNAKIIGIDLEPITGNTRYLVEALGLKGAIRESKPLLWNEDNTIQKCPNCGEHLVELVPNGRYYQEKHLEDGD